MTSRPPIRVFPGAPVVRPESRAANPIPVAATDAVEGPGEAPRTADQASAAPEQHAQSQSPNPAPAADPDPGPVVPAPPSAEPGPFAPLAGDDPLERHRLSDRVVWYWRWRALFSAAPGLLVVSGLAVVVPWGSASLRWAVVAALVVAVGISVMVLPPIRYRVFWYALSPTEIDVQHGIIFIKRTVVPIHRVQNLRTERGPVADHYWFTNLKIKTAAGSVTLSGLDRVEADDLCNRISRLSDVTDDV